LIIVALGSNNGMGRDVLKNAEKFGMLNSTGRPPFQPHWVDFHPSDGL
jgi:hypothetical protein